MEGIHGVDVSWLHHSNKEHHHRLHAPSSPGLSRDTPPPTSSHGGLPKAETQKPLAVQPPQFPATEQVQENTPPPAPPKPASKRPNILSRSSSEKLPSNQTSPPDGSRTPPRRGSWISNISSKFSSQNQTPFQPPHQPFQAPPTTPPRGPSNSDAKGSISSTINGTTVVTSPSSTTPGRKEEEEMAPYVPQPPKAGGGSFFSSALKRLSSGSQLSPSSKSASNGGVIPRKVMNIDSQRPRCLVPELDDKKLRRVAFSVDVEIAGGPRYTDEEEDTSDKKKREKGLKMKEKGEGAALKNPQAVAQEKDSDGVIHATGEPVSNESDPNYERAMPNSEQEPGEKKEKKKRTEEEKKERKERKRRKAEESGSVPVEVTRDSEENSSGSPPISSTPPRSGTPPRPQDRPTTDPVRIYRRCCQLRETPVLKRISEQLSLPSTCALDTPGIVGTLDLTGSRLQLADLLTLGDWLAVVPVKRLLLEDADLTDEGVRVILAGLLAAKTPEEMSSRRHYGRHNSRKAAQRTGVVEKLVLKNNPRITKLGWKHISLFLYMCRSLKSIDVSMITFPKTLSSSAVSSPNGDRTIEASKSPENVAEIFAKSLSERLGGSTLEELIMAECGLTALCIRKVVDAVTVSGVRRLGLASNHLDDEGLEHVLHFLKSGICQGLDIGGNDLRDRLDRLADVLTDQNNLWALCLADCNLSPASLKPLFPALVRLPAFKFIDLSHNRDLFSTDPSALGILRKYIPQMHDFKRLHLVDVSLSPAQAISLAEILPEGPSLAHLNILENPQLSALASAQDEAGQEEACALYASLMAAARVSESIICIDIDVPSQGTSEVVKALARQVVAYCLRNIQRWTTSDGTETASAKASLAGQHGGETDVAFPDVLLHLVGHVEGVNENHDADDPAPDDDYIVGGTGVVKALSYVLGEKARRSSMPASGTVTPKDYAKATEDGKGRAMNMSKNLLGSARKIRDRLRPALVKEANAGDETAYRRLLFLDTTLQNMIQRFEDEYPECRLPKPSTPNDESSSQHSPSNLSRSSSPSLDASTDLTSPSTIPWASPSDDDSSSAIRPPQSIPRHNSDVSIASRALAQEEGEIHRLGQHIRRDILRPESDTPSSFSTTSSSGEVGDSSSGPSSLSPSHPQRLSLSLAGDPEAEHLVALREKLERLGGGEIREKVAREGWEAVMQEIGANAEELKGLRETGDPREWDTFREAQMAAQRNMDPAGAKAAAEKGGEERGGEGKGAS